LHRQERSASLIYRGTENDPLRLAVASDEPLDLNNDAGAAADFIEERFLR